MNLLIANTSVKILNHLIPKEYCFSTQEINNLTIEIQACEFDRIELNEKNKWIEQHLKNNHSYNLEWWQGPQIVTAGIIVSFSFGAILAVLIIHK